MNHFRVIVDYRILILINFYMNTFDINLNLGEDMFLNPREHILTD